MFISNLSTYKTYIIKQALPITHKVELIDKKIFIKAVLDKNKQVFVTYISNLAAKIIIYLGKNV